MHRVFKRIFILIIYLVIFFLIVFVFYSIFREKPSCFDGILNQGEQKIDCGGPCSACEEEIVVEDLELVEYDVVFGGDGKFDVLMKLRNPNNNFGSSGFKYKVHLKDSSSNTLSEREGESYILPAETRYVIETNFETGERPTQVSIDIESNNWERVEIFEEPQINVYNKRYSISNDSDRSEVYGLVRNESRFDFGVVDLNIILKDSSGNIVAINKSDIRDFLAQQERDFKLVWPYKIEEDVVEVEVETNTNVFDSYNFSRAYPSVERFQEY